MGAARFSRLGEGLADQQRMAKILAQKLDTRGLVDGGPDHREVEARVGADIAVLHRADMQCDVEARRLLAGRAARGGRTATSSGTCSGR